MKGCKLNTYENGRQRLVTQLTRMVASCWDVTQQRTEPLTIAAKLRDLADALSGGLMSAFDIQDAHEKDPECLGHFETTLSGMRAIAESAARVNDDLPNSRQRFAMPFAAMVLLHLKIWHDMGVGAIDVDSPIVNELREICEAAGIESNRGELHSEEAMRNELRKQWKKFDRYYYPPGIWEIVSGG